MSKEAVIGLIQASHDVHGNEPVKVHKEKAIAKHMVLIEEAIAKGAQIICLQEIFYGPYFCAEQTVKWYEAAEPIPDGPTTQRFQEVARKNNVVIVLPIYEKAAEGVYYNTAAVIDADGTYLGKYRKKHIPHVAAGEGGTGFWEKYYFKPGNEDYPVFDTKYAKVGVYICYDRHFPEGARLLGLNGAEIVFNPSATVAGTSEYLWKLEQPAHAVANGFYVAAINRVGFEAPWNMGEFYGQSYLVNPRGEFVSMGSRDKDEVIIGIMDRNVIHSVRDQWQFYRDRRPETYVNLSAQL
ncbi:nitrilase-related carbon-nitrogen hydrolase [Aneurinibacillus aneurinilyticus]|jgi:N-carbamoylputrescine amidase|uniref:Acyltransferase n=2 Tax=Aneurinibacillus aneurinilyticus TaxID=1391 RepID=A0A848CSX4_ANEAE|nr:nitrilase-related carbon-nitrogen hydrolase [Aneurinibacillus aneurinilyticus]ERI06943.1 hydrolase, carbon-nitrogen family [Aneurinibacillus aneurinilyticus ATCC 12856]MCI1692240.1 acyltransferase [Aneurinibacillus aneurinilyticus]MED0707880.1 nitrilase-related carbon-nitrogen hydrolase [Aneurinibacillus aneurinilyticus]MED0722293.1 nitrilase-related carbon-nitrogen hydrolase [Aneurinibacillus aneurinilyticus]MED0734210.1 nitrilase-related carbon-nitrogen hydrolase [Aneurinibacillus aneurin